MQKLQNFIKEQNIIVDYEFIDRCEKYINLLLEWGAVHNLTSSGARAKS